MLLWSSLAWAGITEDEAAQEVQRIQLEAGERVLVGALGPEAERIFARQARMNSNLEIELVRIPTAGERERELNKALERAGLRCGVCLSVADGDWTVEPFGDCSPLPEVTADAEVPSPPSPTAAVVHTPSAEENAAIYSRRALSLQETSTAEWNVLEGAERPLSAPAFAALIADPITEQILAQEKRRANIAERSFKLGGAAVASAGLLSLIGMPSVATPQGEDRVWTAVFLGGTGLMAAIIAPRVLEGVAATQMELERYYTPEQASEHVEIYNRSLQIELGLLSEKDAVEEDESAADEDILRELLEPEQSPAETNQSSGSEEDTEEPDSTPAPEEASQ